MQNKFAQEMKIRFRDFRVKRLAKAAKRRKPNHGRITVIKFDGLGDFVLFLDAAKELRKMYPGKTIALSCSPEAKQIAEPSGYFDEIVCFTKQDFMPGNIGKVAKRARALDCEVLLHPTVSRDYFSEIVALFINAGAKYSVCNEHAFPERVNRWIEKQYDEIFDVGKYSMALEQNANFLRCLGHRDFKSAVPTLKVDESCRLCLPTDFFVLFVGGSKWDKIWLEERFCHVAKWIRERTGWTCVTCGVEADKKTEEYFLKNGLEFYSYVGKTSIQELIYIISKARFVFGNDTSATHIAASLNVPTVCVRSAVSKNRFYPYVVDILKEENVLPVDVGVNPKCAGCSLDGKFRACRDRAMIKGKMDCICRVTAEMVIEETERFFKERNIMVNKAARH